MRTIEDMNPFQAIELLKELNRQRKKTRELARTVLKPKEVKAFIEKFQEIEETILKEIEDGLSKWYLETVLELGKMRKQISEMEGITPSPPSEDDEKPRARQ